MSLSASTLASDLEQIFNAKPASAADAAADWAKAYQSYASAAMSTASSLPVTAPANFGRNPPEAASTSLRKAGPVAVAPASLVITGVQSPVSSSFTSTL